MTLRITICSGIVLRKTHTFQFVSMSNSNSPASPTNRLPDLPADQSVWDGPFRSEDEDKEEQADAVHSPSREQGEYQDSQPCTPSKVASNSTTVWSPLPSHPLSPAPNHQSGLAPVHPPPLSPMNQLPMGVTLQEVAKGTLQFHSGFMDHLIDALNQSSLAHDEMCVQVNKSITAMEERALRRLNPDALRYMTGALRMGRQVRPQPQRNGPSWKRRSSKSPTKSERKARAKAARKRSSSSGCGPDCGHPNGPNKRDDKEDPPSYTPLFPTK